MSNLTTNERSIETLRRLLEWYGSQEVEIRADLDAGRKGQDWEREWVRYKNEADALRAGIAALEQPSEPAPATKEQLLRDLNYLYWSAYHAGHHDTVEGRYTDVVAVDRHDYHADAVQDCINSGDMETVRLATEPAGDVVTAMLDYNQMLRSFAMIASRNGEQTRWEGLYDQIHALLAKHHDTWKRYFPPMQPDDEGSIFHQCLVPIQPETKEAKS